MSARRQPCSSCLPALVTLCLAGAVSVPAGPLADPTRPPTSQAAGSVQDGARTGPARAAAVPAAVPAAPTVLPSLLLQAVQTPASGPPMAMINGQLLKAGETIAGRTVLGIDRHGVVLRSPGGDERLWLLGDAGKQAAGSILSARSARFTPAAPAGDAAPDNTGNPGDTNNPRADRNTPSTALSVAGRTAP